MFYRYLVSKSVSKDTIYLVTLVGDTQLVCNALIIMDVGVRVQEFYELL